MLPEERPLFGGAITTDIPLRFQDVSDVRQVPDHQEAFVDPDRDESLVVELLDLKTDVPDQGSAAWFLQDLAIEQDAEGPMAFVMAIKDGQFAGAFSSHLWPRKIKGKLVTGRLIISLEVLEQSGVFEADGLRFRNSPAVVSTAVGQMNISKGRQGREAQNIVKVYLANIRLKEVGTDVLITAYEPLMINPLSESAAAVGAGLAIPATQTGCQPMAEVFRMAVSSFKVNDWSLFGEVA